MATDRHKDVPQLLARLAALAFIEPELPALTFYRKRDLVERLTYSELIARVEVTARRMAATLELRPGDRLAVLSPNRPDLAVLFLAAMRLGLAVVPLDPSSSPEDWDYILGHANARALLVDRTLLPAVQDLAMRALPVDELDTLPEGEPLPRPAGMADDLAIVLYTSRTSGKPRGVACAQGSVLHNAWSMATHFGLERTTQMAILPLYQAHAFGFGMMSALSTGGHLVLCEAFDPDAWPEIIRQENVTVTSLVPALLTALVEARVHAAMVPALRHLLVSSAPLLPQLARNFEERTALPLIQGWGPVQYSGFACCLPPGLPDAERRALLHGERGEQSSSLGPALPGTEVRVVDDAGRPVAEGVPGELVVRGESRMLGYFRDPEATRTAVDRQGWLHTGEQGLFRLHDGSPYFQVTGRRTPPRS